MLANIKVSGELLKTLTYEDRMVLDAVYCHRCLTAPLLCQYFYAQAEDRMGYAQERIQHMVSKKVLVEVEYGRQYPALFLTTLGVAAVRALRTVQSTVLGREKAKLVNKSAYELKMSPKSIPHQMALNAFVLEAGARIGDSIEYQYYDEKFMPPVAKSLMPDGMFEFCDCIVLLEMDMGTERSPHMAKKWNNYRTFLEYKGPFYQDKDIVVLFILDNVKALLQRQRTVLTSVGRCLIDKIDGKFEIYADAPAILQDVLVKRTSSRMRGATELKTRLSAHGYSISKAAFEKITPLKFDAYIRKLTSAGKVMVQSGRPQEFLLDIWFDGRLSVLHKILYYHDVDRALKAKIDRGIPYLVVVPDEQRANRMLALCEARGTQNVFFTTTDRLTGDKFNEALFRLDELGTVYHFSDMGLKETVYERRFAMR